MYVALIRSSLTLGLDPKPVLERRNANMGEWGLLFDGAAAHFKPSPAGIYLSPLK